MKKQKSCLVALAVFASASAFADNAESLVFYGVQGKADNAVELTNFRKITFGENGFNVLSQDGSTLQLNYGDWTHFSCTVEGTPCDGNFSPRSYYGTTGATHITPFTVSGSVLTKL